LSPIVADASIPRLVVVVFVPVAFTQTKSVAEPVPMVALVKIPLVIVPFVAKKLVVVALVPVASVNVSVWRAVVPVAVMFDVLIPPYRVRVAVATDPLFVTVRRVSASGITRQFVPSARQTDCPFTAMAEALSVVPDAFAKPNQPVEVPFVMVRSVMEPLVDWKFVAKRFVDVVFVPVAFVQTMLVGNRLSTVRLVKFALAAKKLVVVAFVDVVFAK